MHRIAIAAASGLLLAGCGSETSGTIEDEDGVERGSYDIDNSTGETTATFETEDGTLRVNSGADVSADLPDGWSLYPGANVVSATNASMGEGKGTMVIFETDDSPEEVTAYYREQAEENDIAIEMEMNTSESRMIAGSSEDGKSLTVNAGQQDGKTVAQLMVGEKFGE